MQKIILAISCMLLATQANAFCYGKDRVPDGKGNCVSTSKPNTSNSYGGNRYGYGENKGRYGQSKTKSGNKIFQDTRQYGYGKNDRCPPGKSCGTLK